MHTASFEGVRDAARQIAGHAVRTPLIESPALNERLGGRALMKAENLQVAGAFKFRGAWNRISRLSLLNWHAASSPIRPATTPRPWPPPPAAWGPTPSSSCPPTAPG